MATVRDRQRHVLLARIRLHLASDAGQLTIYRSFVELRNASAFEAIRYHIVSIQPEHAGRKANFAVALIESKNVNMQKAAASAGATRAMKSSGTITTP